MMLWFKWVFSPVGRWAATVGAAFAILFAAYLKGRKEGSDALRREQEDERNRRARAAVEAGDTVRRDISSGRLLDNDGHRRD